jgi:hypothetical protein
MTGTVRVLVALAAAAVVVCAQPTPSNPFCAFATERNAVSLTLMCEQGVIDEILFASYGLPTGSCPN